MVVPKVSATKINSPGAIVRVATYERPLLGNRVTSTGKDGGEMWISCLSGFCLLVSKGGVGSGCGGGIAEAVLISIVVCVS